jgi:hypothetical protein
MKGTRKITATTPVGTFTRRTARTYSHVIVHFHSAIKYGGTEDFYTAIAWVGRPDLLAARLKGTQDCTAYPVDA